LPYATLSYEWLGPAIFLSGGGAFLLLYLHDRRQQAALRLSGAYLMSLVGFVGVMLVDADRQPAYQALILGSLFAGHFLLLWGVASLFGKDVPWPPFVLAVLLTAGAALYANCQGPLFWVRVIANQRICERCLPDVLSAGLAGEKPPGRSGAGFGVPDPGGFDP
jgi:FtsH-binding integral membrane protein